MMNAWMPITKAGGEDGPEVIVRRGGDPQPTLHHHQVQPQDRQQADQPQLFAQRSERVVRIDQAGTGSRPPIVGSPAPSQHQQAAAPQGVQRLDHLEPGTGRIGPWVQPVVHALLDVAEQVVEHERAGDEQDQATDYLSTLKLTSIQRLSRMNWLLTRKSRCWRHGAGPKFYLLTVGRRSQTGQTLVRGHVTTVPSKRVASHPLILALATDQANCRACQ